MNESSSGHTAPQAGRATRVQPSFSSSASPASSDSPIAAPSTLVWDAPVRVFHWLLALSFAGAYITSGSEHWQVVHVTLGYTVAALVAFRVLWGFTGSRTARFAGFVRGPHAALAYLRGLVRGRPEHHVGHNPAGGLAVLALLGLAALTAATGWATLTYGHAVKEWHETLGNLWLALIIVHVAAVLLSSWLHRENLVAAMLHGRKPVKKAAGIGRARGIVAIALMIGVLSFWGWAWQNGPALTAGSPGFAHHEQVDD